MQILLIILAILLYFVTKLHGNADLKKSNSYYFLKKGKIMVKRGICDLCPQPRGEFIAYLRALATYSLLLQKHIAYHFPGRRTKEKSQLCDSYPSANLAVPFVKLSSLGLPLKVIFSFQIFSNVGIKPYPQDKLGFGRLGYFISWFQA